MSPRTHLVVGAGPIGSAVVRRLAAMGDHVRLVTRSGSGPDLPGVERVAADASDSARLAELAIGAAAVYNCANPTYHRWVQDWPPMATALLHAAETSGAVLVTASNLYGYGEVDRRMTEDMPLAATGTKSRVRIDMWLDALAAHHAGRVRVTEARGADYVGPGAESHLGDRTIPKLLAGKKVNVLASPDTLHTWTYTEDMAATLVALGADERAWGRAWHAPSAMEMSQRDALVALASMAGAPAPRVSAYPSWLISALGVFNPMMRELPEVAYQLTSEFVMDSSAAQQELGLSPTPTQDVLRAILAPYTAAARHVA